MSNRAPCFLPEWRLMSSTIWVGEKLEVGRGSADPVEPLPTTVQRRAMLRLPDHSNTRWVLAASKGCFTYMVPKTSLGWCAGLTLDTALHKAEGYEVFGAAIAGILSLGKFLASMKAGVVAG
jgi:hypothetical protein